MHLIHIVPGLPPRVDGIGDHAFPLAQRLREFEDIQSSFIVGDPNWVGGPIDGFFATKVQAQTPEAFQRCLAECKEHIPSGRYELLVHFSPYSFQKRGTPFWLANALEQLAAAQPGIINMVFHELEVSHGLRPWSSRFWVPPFQRSIIKRVAGVGKFRYTNTEVYREKLESWGVGRMGLIHNFSTVGEPPSNPPFEQRERSIIVFGRGVQRKWAYEHGSAALVAACRFIDAEKIIDIGEPIGENAPDLQGIPIVRCGSQPAHEVSRLMAGSIGSFIHYPIPVITKSSIYAVSCAHGTIPFILEEDKNERSCPGLVPGEDYIPTKCIQEGRKFASLREISDSVYRNGQKRTSTVAAASLAKYLRAEGGCMDHVIKPSR